MFLSTLTFFRWSSILLALRVKAVSILVLLLGRELNMEPPITQVIWHISFGCSISPLVIQSPSMSSGGQIAGSASAIYACGHLIGQQLPLLSSLWFPFGVRVWRRRDRAMEEEPCLINLISEEGDWLRGVQRLDRLVQWFVHWAITMEPEPINLLITKFKFGCFT